MATNLDIDPNLIDEALRLGECKSKRAVVEAALREYVAHRRQRTITHLFGTIDYEADYDYKKHRQRE